jgi:hypothetical protein
MSTKSNLVFFACARLCMFFHLLMCPLLPFRCSFPLILLCFLCCSECLLLSLCLG